MRKIYETEEDLQREAAVIKQIEHSRKVRFLKLPMTWKVDGLILHKNKPFAWAEIKTRAFNWGEFPDVILSLKKLKAGLLLQKYLQGESGKLELLFFVSSNSGIYYTKLRQESEYEVKIGGRYKDKRDEYDVERVAHIPIEDFKKL